MSSSVMAMKMIIHILLISLVSARPSLPLRALPRANSHPQGVRIPMYMMNLYQALMGRNKELKRPGNNILEESDTVQSLPAKDITVEDNRLSLTFDLTPISSTDDLQMVELRVHLPPFTKSSNITVDIYHVQNGQNKLFLGSVMTSIRDIENNAWATFNVTKMIENSLVWGKRLMNHGDEDMNTRDMPDRNLFEYSRNIKKRDVSLPEITTDQAIIVFFTKHKPLSKPDTPSLIKKLAVSSMKKFAFGRHKTTTKMEHQLENPSSMSSVTIEHNTPACRKVDMMVDFKEIGWDKWVVYPKKYNAFRCEGTCHSPRKETSKTTNHDYIKSFIKLKDSERMECSSCVPLKMQPLSMMFHENRHLVVRHHNDMIIQECGFQ